MPHTCETCGAPATIAVRDFAGPPGCWEPAVAEHWCCCEHLRDARYNVHGEEREVTLVVGWGADLAPAPLATA